MLTHHQMNTELNNIITIPHLLRPFYKKDGKTHEEVHEIYEWGVEVSQNPFKRNLIFSWTTLPTEG